MNTVSPLGRFGLNVSLMMIQEIRLCGAILESDFDVCFPAEAEPVLKHLEQYFDIKYQLGLDNVPLLQGVSIEHETPLCRIGEAIQAPLIFPQSMIQRCRAKWREERSNRFSFCGIVTKQRKQCLDTWIRSHFGWKALFVRVKESTKRQEKPQSITDAPTEATKTEQVYKSIGLCVFTSDRGRKFPIKVWDEDYYEFLSTSQFVLCPDGNFTWTYRFFEAILCGAIPIVQNTCNLYDGFEYFRMSDSLNKLEYSQEIAERNFHRAKELLTVPREKLNSQLAELFKQAQIKLTSS